MPGQQYAHMTVKRGTSFSAYQLDSDDVFSPSDYKLMRGQRNAGLISCVRSRFNGLPKLTYFPDGLVPVASCLFDMSPNQFATIFTSLVSEILRVENNGFLDICKIDINLDAFFINTETGAAGIIYLPVKQQVSGHKAADVFNLYCQHMFLTMGHYAQLKPLIRTIASFANSSMGKFDYLLGRMSESFKIDAVSLSKGNAQEGFNDEQDLRLSPLSTARQDANLTTYRLVGKSGPVPIDISIASGSLVIGKSQFGADYVISGVPTVSNRHCEISINQQSLFVKDLKSTNGTFINGRRLPAQELVQLRQGDELGISSLLIQVSEVK